MLPGVNCCRDHALRQAFAATSREKEPYKDLPSNILRELIKCSQEEDLTTKETRRALALPWDLVTKCPGDNKVNYYRDTWEEIDSLLYRKKCLYVPPVGEARKEILRQNHEQSNRWPLCGQADPQAGCL
jgi:hypothetical protein